MITLLPNKEKNMRQIIN